MDNDQNNCPEGTGPGSRLCQARVGLGWSRAEVAQRLHLSLHQILALENDDYAHLPGSTYVRGYLRAYANLVNLKSDNILAAYSVLTDGNKTCNLTSLAPKEEITSQHHHVKFATYAVVAILLGLALTWWQGRENGPDTASTEPNTEQFTGVVDDPGVPQTDASVPLPTLPGDAPETAATAPTLMPPPHAEVAPVPVRAAPVPKPALATIARSAASPEPNTRLSTEPPSDVPEVRANLALHAEAESWMDVRDAHGNKLLYQTVPAGRSIVLDGALPMRVFLGNAAGVRAEFNGRPYDVNRHQRGLVARFTLGEELVPPAANAADR